MLLLQRVVALPKMRRCAPPVSCLPSIVSLALPVVDSSAGCSGVVDIELYTDELDEAE
jgi:hypothetical protein